MTKQFFKQFSEGTPSPEGRALFVTVPSGSCAVDRGRRIQRRSSYQASQGPTGNKPIGQEKSGSTENQIYLLTQKVARLSSHLKIHKKDYSSQKGLRKLLGKRKRLLSYLANADSQRYENILILLGIRGLKKS